MLLFLTEPLNITMDGQELLQTSYEPTKLMSTYTLAVAVCDFGFRGTRLADNTLVRTTHALRTPSCAFLLYMGLCFCS